MGFITISQNDIFQVLTVASIVGIPPTLMAGVYGMISDHARAELDLGLPSAWW